MKYTNQELMKKLREMTDQEEKDRLIEEVCGSSPPKWSDHEEGYRKGYAHGFQAARDNPDIDIWKVQKWRHSDEETAPPGSELEGYKLHGLKKDEEHRYFENAVKKQPIKKEDFDPIW